MKCKACDIGFLNDYELSRKDADTGDFIDLCGRCYSISNEASHSYTVDVDAGDLDINDTKGSNPWLIQR